MSIFSLFKNKIIYEYDNWKIAKFRKRALLEFDPSWFEGKRVAIVGGADSVLKKPLGDYIDKFDVVVRVNKGVEVISKQKDYVGTRTDVLFHAFYVRENDKGSSPITTDLWRANKVGKLIFSHNENFSGYARHNFNYFLRLTKGKMPVVQVPEEMCQSNASALAPFSPTTGFIAINTIFHCLPQELYITGITFFKTAHNAFYREGKLDEFKRAFKTASSHNSDKEYSYVRSLYSKYPHLIKPDDTLKAIFDEK